MKKKAWINWSREQSMWVLRLYIDDEWAFCKAWEVKDECTSGGNAWVFDAILCEIAALQDLGWEVRVTA